MVAPAVWGLAMAAPSIISGIASFLNNREADSISAQERARLEGLVNALQSPDFSEEDLDPVTFKVLENYVPQVATFVAETAPTLVTGETQGAREGMALEKQFLQEMLGQAQTGEDAELAIARNKARRLAEQGAQSGRATMDSQMARRGFTPSGPLAYALQADQASQGALRGALAGEQAVQDAANRRRDAWGQVGQAGQRMTNRADNLEERNAQLLNAFNARVATMGNQYNQYAANTQNQANQFNIGQRQSAADKTAQSAQDAQKYNIGRQDQIAEAKSRFERDKVGLQTGASNARTQGAYQNAQTNNAALGALGQAATAGIGAYAGMQKDDELDWTKQDRTKPKSGVMLGGF